MSDIRRLPRRLRAFPSAGLDEWSQSKRARAQGSSGPLWEPSPCMLTLHVIAC
jgi:hypothetical protein